MDTMDLANQTLESVAEKCEDLTTSVYERFGRISPQGMALLAPVAPVVRGRMLHEMLYAYSSRHERPCVVDNYLEQEAMTHAAFGIGYPVYEALFAALFEEVSELLGEDWPQDAKLDWQLQTRAMLGAIQSGLLAAKRSGIEVNA